MPELGLAKCLCTRVFQHVVKKNCAKSEIGNRKWLHIFTNTIQPKFSVMASFWEPQIRRSRVGAWRRRNLREGGFKFGFFFFFTRRALCGGGVSPGARGVTFAGSGQEKKKNSIYERSESVVRIFLRVSYASRSVVRSRKAFFFFLACVSRVCPENWRNRRKSEILHFSFPLLHGNRKSEIGNRKSDEIRDL